MSEPHSTGSQMSNEEMIEDVMMKFDFDKVHKAMTAVNWEWRNAGGVPSVIELKTAARGLLHKAAMSHGRSFSSGGFTACLYSDGVLSLEFTLEIASTEEDE